MECLAPGTVGGASLAWPARAAPGARVKRPIPELPLPFRTSMMPPLDPRARPWDRAQESFLVNLLVEKPSSDAGEDEIHPQGHRGAHHRERDVRHADPQLRHLGHRRHLPSRHPHAIRRRGGLSAHHAAGVPGSVPPRAAPAADDAADRGDRRARPRARPASTGAAGDGQPRAFRSRGARRRGRGERRGGASDDLRQRLLPQRRGQVRPRHLPDAAQQRRL